MTHAYRKGALALMATASLFAIIAAPAFAQDTTEAPKDEAIVVTGFKKSYADALRMKRAAVGVSDSISSDGLSRFPDLNVGEALQRIPGVQVNREEDSRNASINLRGLPGSYAKITLNGMNFASPVLGGSAPLGAFNSDIFSAISVIKSVSAADQPGGISGNIDLQIQPALSRKDGAWVKVSSEYNTLGKYFTPSVTVSGTHHFGDRLAVFGTVAYREENFRRDSIHFPQYTTLNTTTTPNFASRFADYYAPFQSNGSCASGQVCAASGTGAKSTTGILLPSDIRQGVKYNEGNLLTGVFAADYKVSDNLKVGAMYFYSNRDMPLTATDILDMDMRDGNTIIDPQTAPYLAADGRYYVDKYNFTNPRVFASYRKEAFKQMTNGLNLTAEYRNDDWRISGALSWSEAENFGYQSQLDVRNTAKPLGSSGTGNGLTGSFYSGGDNIDNFAFKFNQSTALVTDTSGPWTNPNATPSGPVLVNPNGNNFIVAGSDNAADNSVGNVQVDVERFFQNAWMSSLQFGLRAEKDEYVSTGYRGSVVGVQAQNIDSRFVVQSEFAGDFFGEDVNYQRNWQTVDFDYALSKLQPVTLLPGQRLTYGGWVNDPADGTFTNGHYTKKDDITSAYLMAKIDTEVLGVRVRGHAGVRQETTKQVITSLDRTGSGLTATFKLNTRETEYSNTLPSLLLAADLSDKLVLRLGAYQTFVRPNPRDISPLTTTVTSTTDGYTVALGRVDIEPYTSDSYDLSLEWYNRPGGLIAFAIYKKEILGQIQAETRDAVLCPAEGYGLGLGTWSVDGDICYSTLTTNTGGRARIDVNGAINSPLPLTVTGAELSIQQNFDFLPAPWNNLGGAFNYSYADVNGRTVAGASAVLPGVSRNSANLIVYYETTKFGIRAVYNYRDKYDLAAGGTFAGAARSVKARGQFDVSASYNLSDRITLGVDAFNLSDERRTEYEGDERKVRRVDYDGRTFQVSVRASF
ncbi:hypothetical protein ABAC460_23255 [Asticcacaulis sp. AC460]|uniref:TonB-dependent receptor n=1 Tax=Asticcacaulis sp. AC460 TaxID=1282360 RepID=UPI0003C3D5FF|nr:TonB-dependent receptor [Asticcacaulis sp. AC460]ESQ86522.1 hypothetical protein ABAC460_23255 [Asticcacaulis sp. AC460]